MNRENKRKASNALAETVLASNHNAQNGVKIRKVLYISKMKNETKKKASNACIETSLAPKQNAEVLTSITLHFCISYCNRFLHCVVKGLSVLLQHAWPLVSFRRFINNAESRAINYFKS